MTVNELKSKKVAELKTLARNAGIDGYDAMKKAELVEALAEVLDLDHSLFIFHATASFLRAIRCGC